jgi:hypothetical protein
LKKPLPVPWPLRRPRQPQRKLTTHKEAPSAWRFRSAGPIYWRYPGCFAAVWTLRPCTRCRAPVRRPAPPRPYRIGVAGCPINTLHAMAPWHPRAPHCPHYTPSGHLCAPGLPVRPRAAAT